MSHTKYFPMGETMPSPTIPAGLEEIVHTIEAVRTRFNKGDTIAQICEAMGLKHAIVSYFVKDQRDPNLRVHVEKLTAVRDAVAANKKAEALALLDDIEGNAGNGRI